MYAEKISQVAPENTELRVLPNRWVAVCHRDDVLPNMGVAVLVNGHQIAIFRLADDRVFAVSNFDPFSKAFVLSRGIVGDRNGEIKIASPIYKQNFSLSTGKCLDDASVQLRTWSARIVDDCIEIGL